MIAQDKLLEVLYESSSGPVSPIDILFGNRKEIFEGNEYMAKKGGFTYTALDRVFFEAGFNLSFDIYNSKLSYVKIKNQRWQDLQ